jgi:hypothetical protein
MTALTKSLVVAVALTFVPMQAWAECAWVLWLKATSLTGPDVGSADWTTLSGFERFGDCETTRRAPLPTFAVKGLSVRREGDVYYLTNERGTAMGSFLCLPDTIDPRGPKGGAR